ncbi:hypothetical protein PDO_0015 [Rhizobium sp. PDO1-076]|uniref:hypothetical protein n=1 Tax=Rhizobium sp. PDO1-076 TaxID=1125979 RepID=UPI00024E2589|nr:hypothetical protein [Rhizobium sp. PDO1-076]EHS52387.1 hypothetical protein PDO_0015 [Rhizobium sp. PDO1-076]
MSKKPKRNHLKKLIKAWAQATTEDRDAFLDFVAAETRANGIAPSLVLLHDRASMVASGATPMTADVRPTATTTIPVEPLIANGRYLLPATIERIEAVMRARRLSPRAVMAEMGFPADDHALARALAMRASLRLSVIAALRQWLESNRAHIR